MTGSEDTERMDSRMSTVTKRWIACLTALLLLPVCSGAALAAGQSVRPGYPEYAAEHGEGTRPQTEICVDAVQYARAEDSALSVVTSDGKSGLATGGDGLVEWRFTVAESGLYDIEITYRPLPGKGADIRRALYINGEIPFEELSSISLPRTWRDADGEIRTDAAGNELRPEQVEVDSVQKRTLTGSDYTAGEPVSVWLEAGENTVALQGISEPMVVYGIRFFGRGERPSYREVADGYTYAPAAETIRIEGEDAVRRSDKSLYAVCDRSSGQSSPVALGKTVFNAIGGANWSEPLQWIEWEFDVPADGLYRLAIRGKQDTTPGQISSRRLYIDGEVPFAEAEGIGFSYGLGFRCFVPSDEAGEPYLFALSAGHHTLRLENDVGAVSSLLGQVDEAVKQLDEIYAKVFRITGSYPDADRDYALENALPELPGLIEKAAAALSACEENCLALTGEKGDGYASMERVLVLLRIFEEDTEALPARLELFRTNVSSLAAWLLTAVSQPLLIDWIEWQPADSAVPQVEAGFFGRAWFAVRSFVNSFLSDYDTAGAGADGSETVTVWLGTGRDQMRALEHTALTGFVEKYGIGVNIRLVDINVLLPAVAADCGPDAAIGLERLLPLNYAYRGAVSDLSGFDGFAELAAQFPAQALTEFTYGDAVYALPDKYTFYMLFYRQDILDEIGADVPQTWAQLYALLPRLQTQHMTVGLPNLADNVIDIFTTLLYQRGGNVYDEALTCSTLDSEEALSAFKDFTDLYTKYKVLQKIDALSYFRTGQTPITLQPYTFFANLEASAPEIRGRWGFAPMPGTAQEDGTVDHTVSGTATGCCIFRNSAHEQAAWTFLRWFLGEEAQTTYGSELETIQGTAGRYATANLGALRRLPWTDAQLTAILRQAEMTRAMPEAPGGYMTARYIISAATTVINNGLLPRDTLTDYTKNINDEVSAMRRKLGLDEEGAEA